MKLSDRRLLIGVTITIVVLVAAAALFRVYWKYILVRHYVRQMQAAGDDGDARLVPFLALSELERGSPGADFLLPFYENCIRDACGKTKVFDKGDYLGQKFWSSSNHHISSYGFTDVSGPYSCWQVWNCDDPREACILAWLHFRMYPPPKGSPFLQLYVVSLQRELLPEDRDHSWTQGGVSCTVTEKPPAVRIGGHRLDPAGAPYIVLIQSDGKIYDIRRVGEIRKEKP
jgi:hypothetical protein